MKTIEQQLDDMLPEDFKRQRALAAARIKYYKRIGTALRQINDAYPTAFELSENIKANFSHAGLTVEQATENMNAAVAAARNENLM